MKLPKDLQQKQKKVSTPNSKKARIKKNFPVYVITCKCHNEPIPCPSCEEIEFLRGWDENERMLALCYFCETVFYCDTNEIVDVFTGNPSLWAPRVIAMVGASKENAQNINRNVKPEDCFVITHELLEDLFEGGFFEDDPPEENPELERRAKKEITRRFTRGTRPIRLTLEKIVPTPEFQGVKESLRAGGWKDWHLLLAILNLVFQYRMNELGLKGEEQVAYLKEKAYLEENKDAIEVPLTEFTLKNLYRNLYLSVFATMRSYGYEIDNDVEVTELAEILYEINYWEYDVPHEPIFDL